MRTRYAAYAVCIDSGFLLLTQLREGGVSPGHWTLPGGGLRWREPPEQGVLRELHEETGLEGRVKEVLGIDTEIHPEWNGPATLHSVRFIYRVEARGEPIAGDASTVAARWVPYEELVDLPLVPLVPRGLAMI